MDKETVYFCWVMLATGEEAVCTTSSKSLHFWRTGDSKLLAEDLKRLHIEPIQRGETIAGFNVRLMPLSMIKTPQKEVYINPTSLEILGEVKEVSEGVYSCSNDRTQLFSGYQEFLKQWRAELASIAAPTQADINAVRKNLIDFPGKR